MISYMKNERIDFKTEGDGIWKKLSGTTNGSNKKGLQSSVHTPYKSGYISLHYHVLASQNPSVNIKM